MLQKCSALASPLATSGPPCATKSVGLAALRGAEPGTEAVAELQATDGCTTLRWRTAGPRGPVESSSAQHEQPPELVTARSAALLSAAAAARKASFQLDCSEKCSQHANSCLFGFHIALLFCDLVVFLVAARRHCPEPYPSQLYAILRHGENSTCLPPAKMTY